MRQLPSFIVYWLPIILWMMTIFTASGDRGSFQHSSRFLEPFLHWLLPHLSTEAFRNIVLVIRKCAHLTEYAVMALLVLNARRKPLWRGDRLWQWSQAGEALWVAVLYAATDEFHQTFIPSREGCLRDVVIDSSGAVAGLILVWAFGRWRKFW